MAITINLKEKDKKLEIVQPSVSIACGNYDYVLHFDLSEEWQDCELKTAVFIVNSKEFDVLFSGQDCNVPVLPNAPFVMISLCSAGELDKPLTTTPVRIELQPTIYGESFEEANESQNFVGDLLGITNSIKTHKLTVDVANHAITADNATNADHATSASTSESATEATHAESASNADKAAEATHALSADSANNAAEATHALKSDNATEATHAATADMAEDSKHASNADHATNAISANTSISAESAVYAATAGRSNTQVDLSSDQDISGTKNFTGELKVNGAPIMTFANASNYNYLINSDFKVNLRGKESYTSRTYTVDRWINGDITTVVTPQEGGGVKFEKIFDQTAGSTSLLSQSIEDFERLFEKTVTMSVKLKNNTSQKGVGITVCGSNTATSTTHPYGQGIKYCMGDGIFSYTATLPSTLEYNCLNAVIMFDQDEAIGSSTIIEWAKVEVGSYATAYCPRLYAEELLLCNRYYTLVSGQVPAVATFDGNEIYPVVYLPCALRTSPTMVDLKAYSVRGGDGVKINNVTNVKIFSYDAGSNCLVIHVTSSQITGNFAQYSLHNGSFGLDAEIY